MHSLHLFLISDWVYCEVSPFQPYVIRKIEELTKTPSGNVEAKVICAFRHQEIPASVIATVEKFQQKNKNNLDETKTEPAEVHPGPELAPSTFEEADISDLNELQRHNLRHREVYFSKYTDTIAATTIRSKCSVLLFNDEVERYSEYLHKDDQFFYHLTYDPSQKSLVADKGEIRVGSRYQAEIVHTKFSPNGSMVEEAGESQDRVDRVLRSQQKNKDGEIPIAQQGDEIMAWCPIGLRLNGTENNLSDKEIDQFIIIAKSVGTFARALDCNNSFKQPSLQLSAASASRDITLFHAMNALHENNYDIGKATLSLVPENGPLLCRDELEEWSAVEANLFEDALEKYGKDFAEIRKDYVNFFYYLFFFAEFLSLNNLIS
ncbi:metastasis-associated MTA3 isoform X2 [Brachionus plicatilis]|uniref:Metastasis-associated MTA3 isoform X2 n=1 Tax=Brachionus plicatilis TaxID=10195 RepID=A0A3M7P9P3_BRAPC|nr:metastasis-associated MTA3 isoform X2 [Brachionus plicatilis]